MDLGGEPHLPWTVGRIEGHKADLQFSELLDSCFSVPDGMHFLDDFPVWDSHLKGSSLIKFGIFYGDQLVASTGVRLAQLKTPAGGSVPVAILGAVATHLKWRSKGLASRLVLCGIQWAREQNAALVLLWGSEHRFYQRFGFELCGEQRRVPLKSIELKKGSLISIHSGWNVNLWEAIKKRSGGLILNEDDQSWYEAHKNVKWFSISCHNEVLAYAGFGRGIDLNGLVHEWGGQPQLLSEILQFIRNDCPDAELLGSEAHFREKNIMVSQTGVQEFLCMAKILDPEQLVRSWTSESQVKAKCEKNQWTLSVGERVFPSMTEQQLVRFLLGPQKGDSMLFPLKIWIWGLDAA